MNTQQKTINRIIFILSIAGLLMGIYVLQSFLRQTGIICLSGGGCEAVRKSALSYPFGIPVPAIGVVGYAFLVILTFLRTVNEKFEKNLLSGILGMATFGICFVTWFTYTEIFLIKGICMWCAISAVNMYVIFALTLISIKIGKKS
ncbi:MAG: hypothetical protein UT26_C0041G0002 [Microgenomates group bacterium GW2011_GWC1_39_12]|nr:MAG: hypothetical protein UT26_C0041G0002 [Microgenomates group bacterium GW2011_GWC1_39_12]